MAISGLSCRPGAFLVAMEPNLSKSNSCHETAWEVETRWAWAFWGQMAGESQRSGDVINMELGMFISC